MTTTVCGSLSLEVEGDPATIGKMVVLGLVGSIAEKMPQEHVTDCLLGMIATCAGLIATAHGPAVANQILQRLPEISVQAAKDATKPRH